MADSFVSRFGCYTIIWDTTTIGPGGTIRGDGCRSDTLRADRYSSVGAIPSGSGSREARIHTSYASSPPRPWIGRSPDDA